MTANFSLHDPAIASDHCAGDMKNKPWQSNGHIVSINSSDEIALELNSNAGVPGFFIS